MGSKFSIMFSKYPFKGYWEGTYNTDSFFKFFYLLAKLYFKNEIIDVQIRTMGSGEATENTNPDY